MSEPWTRDPLLGALRDPQALASFGELEWEALLARARATHLLGRLDCLLVERGLMDRVPEKARLRFLEARTFATRNQTDIRFEVNRVTRALSSLDIPIVLLKGAAYMFANLPPACGRLASDLDIMVRKESIETVEHTLLAAGWQTHKVTDYDDHYYREWMHEIPALCHPDRLLVVDVHHTIIPITSRYKPNTKALLASAVDLGDRSLKVLCPADMVLHSAAHLFNEEFTLGPRGIADLNDLLEHFGKTGGFWNDLLARSHLHGLERILYYLLRYTRRVFGTEIPNDVEKAAQTHAPHIIVRVIMDVLVMSALKSSGPGQSHPRRAIALSLLRIRSHWLKMPPLLLARHLITKALYRWRRRSRPTSASAEAKPN